jgi:DNA polymerase
VNPKQRLPDNTLDRRQIRFAIRAPKHHVVLSADLAQIEARLNAWESGCKQLVQAFANKKDIYSEFATSIFHVPVRKGDPATEKQRFVGKTCILGLGYGMGPPKLVATLRKDKIKLDIVTSEQFVGTYRTMYWQIPAFWKYCDETIEIMAQGGARRIGPCMARGNVIELPNGMELVYHNLRWISDDDGDGSYQGWVYDYGGMTKTLWGGKVVENITQALARIIITDAMRAARRELGLLCKMQAHDELVYNVLERDAPMYSTELSKIMVRRPQWAPDLPIEVEAKFGPTYGDAK